MLENLNLENLLMGFNRMKEQHQMQLQKLTSIKKQPENVLFGITGSPYEQNSVKEYTAWFGGLEVGTDCNETNWQCR